MHIMKMIFGVKSIKEKLSEFGMSHDENFFKKYERFTNKSIRLLQESDKKKRLLNLHTEPDAKALA